MKRFQDFKPSSLLRSVKTKQKGDIILQKQKSLPRSYVWRVEGFTIFLCYQKPTPAVTDYSWLNNLHNFKES